jgi:hypothetical protein
MSKELVKYLKAPYVQINFCLEIALGVGNGNGKDTILSLPFLLLPLE